MYFYKCYSNSFELISLTFNSEYLLNEWTDQSAPYFLAIFTAELRSLSTIKS